MDCTNDGVTDIFGTPALPTAVPSILPTVVVADVNKTTVPPTPVVPPVLLTASPVPLTVSPSVAEEGISDLPPSLPTAVPAVSIVTPVADEPTPGVLAVPTVSPIVDEQTPQVSPVARPTEPTIAPATADQTQNLLIAEPTVESISLGIEDVESNLATSDVLTLNNDISNHSPLGSDNTSTLEALDTITPVRLLLYKESPLTNEILHLRVFLWVVDRSPSTIVPKPVHSMKTPPIGIVA